MGFKCEQDGSGEPARLATAAVRGAFDRSAGWPGGGGLTNPSGRSATKRDRHLPTVTSLSWTLVSDWLVSY